MFKESKIMVETNGDIKASKTSPGERSVTMCTSGKGMLFFLKKSFSGQSYTKFECLKIHA